MRDTKDYEQKALAILREHFQKENRRSFLYTQGKGKIDIISYICNKKKDTNLINVKIKR